MSLQCLRRMSGEPVHISIGDLPMALLRLGAPGFNLKGRDAMNMRLCIMTVGITTRFSMRAVVTSKDDGPKVIVTGLITQPNGKILDELVVLPNEHYELLRVVGSGLQIHIATLMAVLLPICAGGGLGPDCLGNPYEIHNFLVSQYCFAQWYYVTLHNLSPDQLHELPIGLFDRGCSVSSYPSVGPQLYVNPPTGFHHD